MWRFISILPLLLACAESAPPEKAGPAPAAPRTWAARSPQTASAPVLVRTVSTLPPRAARADNSACADCHPEQAESFAKTGMGRSMARLPGPPVIEDFSKAEKVHLATGLIYRAYRDAEGRYWQEERHPSHDSVRRIEATHVIGSGNHTRSYLGRIDDELVQLPLTWYAQRRIWDFSPGYEVANMPRFGRRVEAPCLFCHNGLTPLAEGRSATYQWPLAEGIGCDRCHGDGQAHVAARMAGKGPAPGAQDATIFNPKHHSQARQLQVCQQCHLQADASVVHAGHRWDAYDPRLPLDAYLSVFRKAGDDGAAFSIASHGRRLALSACAKGTEALSCTTCHNPHATATEASYRAACQGCHGGEAKAATGTPAQAGCSDPAGKAPDASCHTCHMRSGGTSDVPHVEFTDHYIRRRPTADTSKPARGTRLVDMVAGAAEPDAWLLGMGHTFLWERLDDPVHLPEALRLLGAAVKTQPDEPRAVRSLARALVKMGKGAEAEQMFAKAQTLGADDERFLFSRAQNLLEGRQKEALAAFETLAARFPSGRAWLGLAKARRQAGDQAGELEALKKAEGFQDSVAAAKTHLAGRALRARRTAEAKALLEAARTADPLHLPAVLWRATIAMDEGKFADAIKQLDFIISRNPEVRPAWALRGQARIALKQVDAGLADLDRLLQFDNDKPQAWVMYIRSAAKAGRVDLARAKLAKALEKFPGDPRVMGAAQVLRQTPPVNAP